MFLKSEITNDDIAKLKDTGVLSETPVIDPMRLVKLTLSYIDFEGNVHHDGQMMVLDAVGPSVMAIFEELFNRRFPIHRIKLLNDYGADDEASMADNNSSAFCDRAITGASRPSIHAYGCAFDINPLQNPYIKGSTCLPYDQFLERTPAQPGFAEDIVDLCARHGFDVWGGHWSQPIDYQHFQTSREMAETLAKLSPDEARSYFESSL